MASIDKLKASDGSGPASLMTIQTLRSSGASTIIVDTVVGVPATFFGTMGTPDVDTGIISDATAVDFAGTVDGANIEILAVAPGFTDLGSSVGDVIAIKPTTEWADELVAALRNQHNDDGSHGAITATSVVSSGALTGTSLVNSGDAQLRSTSLETIQSEQTFDYVASGCVWTADAAGSTRVASMTAGVVYIGGKRVAVSAVTSRTFNASKDVYVDVDNTGTLTYTDGTTNAASGALAANSIRLAIIVVGASNIATANSINQGQENRVLPIASSVPYTVTDSLGNLICPRDPQRKILGYRRITSTITTTSTTAAQATGLSVPVIVPTGRKIRVSVVAQTQDSAAPNVAQLSIWRGTVGSGTQIGLAEYQMKDAGQRSVGSAVAYETPSSASQTYNLGFANASAGTLSLMAASTNPVPLIVELA